MSLALFVTLVPRALGAGAYGELVVALSLIRIASSSVSLGGPTLVTRFVPVAEPRQRAAVARSLGRRLAAWRAAQVVTIAIVATVVLVLAPDAMPAPVAAMTLLALALDVAATLASQLALALGHAGAWSFRWPVQNAVMVVVVPVLHLVAGTTGAVAGLAIASAAALLLSCLVIAGQLRRAPRGAPIPFGALRFGALQGVSGLSLQVINRGPPVAVVLLGGTSVESGYAGLAVGVALAVTLVVTQAFAVQLPLLAERVLSDAAGVERDAGRLAWRFECALVPVAAIAVIAAEPVLEWVVGPGFAGAAHAFGPALALVPLAPVTALATQVAALRLRAAARVWTTAAGAVVFCAVALLAVPPSGASGATGAMLAGTAAFAATSVAAFPRAFETRLLAAAASGSALVLALWWLA